MMMEVPEQWKPGNKWWKPALRKEGFPSLTAIYLLLKGVQCKCSRVLPDHQEQCSKLSWMHLRSVRQSSFASTATTFRYF